MNELEIKLMGIVKDAAKYGIMCNAVLINDMIAFRVWGFSKSGTVDLYVGDDKILVKARYDKITEIEDFSGLAHIAYDWYINYKNRSPFENPDSYWAEVFKEMDLPVFYDPIF